MSALERAVGKMSKVLPEPVIDSVEVAAEKLYKVVEGHLNQLPAAERKKRLEAIDRVHAQMTSRDSRKRSLRRRSSHPQVAYPVSR